MAVITKYVVVRNGVELDKEFLVKKEAEAYDKMLDAAEKLAAFIREGDLEIGLEDDTIDVYNQFLLTCRENGDSISMKIFETIIDEEQIHFNYFDSIADHIKNLGDAYLARIAGTSSSTGLGGNGFAVSEGE